MPSVQSHVPKFSGHQLGALRNALGILSDDRSKVKPQRLKDVTHLNSSATAKALQVSRPQMYQKEIKLNPKLMKNIILLVHASDLVYELIGESVEETAKWVMAPNSMLKGDSPFEVCIRGDGQLVIDWLNARLGRVAGQAF